MTSGRLLLIRLAAVAVILFLLCSSGFAQTNEYKSGLVDGKYVIGHYTGTNRTLVIPSQIKGVKVVAIENYTCFLATNLASITLSTNLVRIGYRAFSRCTGLTRMVIPSSVTSIERLAFAGCTNLTAVFFEGNAPGIVSHAFDDCPATLYRLPGAKGWETAVDDCPVAIWAR